MITPEQSAALKDYFPVEAHEFLQGKTYIREDDITDRLDEVDPSWTFERLDITVRDAQVVAIFRLTVCGVWRDGVGMDSIKQGGAGEAEKSAATDALKRAARLFGIGRYILSMKGVSDAKATEAWLAKQRRIDTNTGEMQQSNVTPLNSHEDAQMPIAAGQNVELPATPKNGTRTPQQALNGNGAHPGEKKRIGNEPPKEGDYGEFQVTSVKVVFKDGQPRYALNATDNAVIWAYSRDVFRGMGYPEGVIEDWGTKEQTIKFEQKMPLQAEWKLYKTGKEPRGGYWSALFEAPVTVISEEPF